MSEDLFYFIFALLVEKVGGEDGGRGEGYFEKNVFAEPRRHT